MQLVPRQCLSQTPHLRSLVNLFLLPLIWQSISKSEKGLKGSKEAREKPQGCYMMGSL